MYDTQNTTEPYKSSVFGIDLVGNIIDQNSPHAMRLTPSIFHNPAEY